jgi:hypothetical protein
MMVPTNHAAHPPCPSDPALILRHSSRRHIYVAPFRGRITQERVLVHALQLSEALHREGRAFDLRWVWACSYDHPGEKMRRGHNHSEVWVYAREEKEEGEEEAGAS